MTRHILAFAALYVLGTVAGAYVLRHAPASAERPDYQGARVRQHDALTLARMVAGETGPDELDVATAQIGVIARRAALRRTSIGTMARLYSAALRHPTRPWVLHLEDRRRAPAAWPDRASWTAYRPRFAELVLHVERVLAGDVADPCPNADHFGSAALDGHRAARAGWARVCGDVHPRQAFYDVDGAP